MTLTLLSNDFLITEQKLNCLQPVNKMCYPKSINIRTYRNYFFLTPDHFYLSPRSLLPARLIPSFPPQTNCCPHFTVPAETSTARRQSGVRWRHRAVSCPPLQYSNVDSTAGLVRKHCISPLSRQWRRSLTHCSLRRWWSLDNESRRNGKRVLKRRRRTVQTDD